jgi:2-polyprenyl-3-methyl-5-hydroxy-6-metoxy-1,4-benzoquinol methylase
MANTQVYRSEYHAGERPEMLKFVPPHLKTFLEIGCGEGNFSQLVRNTYSAEMWGIEANPNAASIAMQKLDHVVSGGVEENIHLLPDHFFDCIAMNDVLEHLVSPWDVLVQLKNKLSDNGIIILSIPNFRYWKNLREIVVRGEWRYVESGILDRTHLRFFTYKSILRMMKDLRFEVVTIEPMDERGRAILSALNALLLFRLWDLKYVHFACVVRPLDGA